MVNYIKYRNITYCFTTKLSKYNNNDYILTFYKLSMTRAKEFGHTISFYGCKYSIDFLKGYYDNCIDVSNEKFQLVDDLKLYVHENGNIDTITIDGDLILNKELIIDDTVDIVYDANEYLDIAPWGDAYNMFLHPLKKYPIEEVINGFKFNTSFAINVGILKFNNNEVKTLFIETYKEFKEYYLKSIEPIENFKYYDHFISIIICQFLFASLIKEKNISAVALKYGAQKFRYDNHYWHWIGQTKFSSSAKSSFKEYNIKLPGTLL